MFGKIALRIRTKTLRSLKIILRIFLRVHTSFTQTQQVYHELRIASGEKDKGTPGFEICCLSRHEAIRDLEIC